MSSSLVAVLLTFSAYGQMEVNVRTLSGTSVQGQLQSLSDQELRVQSKGREAIFSPAQLEAIGIQEKAATSRWKVEVGFVDGSLIHAKSYLATQGKATIVFADGEAPLEVAVKAIRMVRLRDQQGELAQQWNDYLADPATSDRIVIRRKPRDDEKRATESLDILEGAVLEVREGGLDLDISGDVLKVKREKLEGILYFRGREPQPVSPECMIVDIDHSRWAVRSVALDGDSLKFTTCGGLSRQLPLDRVRLVDYASANCRYLCDLPRDSQLREDWLTPGVKSSVELFRPLANRSPEGPLLFGGQPSLNSLWLPARSSFIVQVPTGFSHFTGKAAFDDRTISDGAKLKIESDGKTLFEKVIIPQELATPINVHLVGARRIRFTVDYGGESFVGDQIVLSEAMFTK